MRYSEQRLRHARSDITETMWFQYGATDDKSCASRRSMELQGVLPSHTNAIHSDERVSSAMGRLQQA